MGFSTRTFIKKKNMVDLKKKELLERESFKESPAPIVVNSFKHEVDG
jgi:hypothetical protein